MDSGKSTFLFTAAGQWLCLLILLTSLSSCLPSITASNVYDRSANFAGFRTFAILEPVAVGTSANPTQFEPLLDRRVRDAIASEMVKKGLTPDAESPDLLIGYDVSIPQDTNQTTAGGQGNGYSYWYGYRYNYSTEGIPNYRRVDEYPVGTLLIDLIDPVTNQLVWRGSAAGEINATQTEESKIRRSIIAILAQYPPF